MEPMHAAYSTVNSARSMFASRDEVPTCAVKAPLTRCQPPRRPPPPAGTISSLQIESSLREISKRT